MLELEINSTQTHTKIWPLKSLYNGQKKIKSSNKILTYEICYEVNKQWLSWTLTRGGGFNLDGVLERRHFFQHMKKGVKYLQVT